jgi:hypothetical protein
MAVNINIPKPVIDYNDLDNKPNLVTEHSELILDDGTNPHGTTASDVGALPMPTGTTSQYLRGDGSLETFPMIPNPANFVAKADYTSHSILAKQSGGSDPVAVSIGTNEILGRKSGGGSNIEGLSVSEVKSLLNYTASDVGAPSGSGSSTGTNTGDETESSLLTKLGVTKLKVTGDQSTTSTTAVDITDLVSGTLEAGKYAVNGSIRIGSTTTAGVLIGITIPSGATMAVHAVGRGSSSANNVRLTLTSSGSLSSSAFAQVVGETTIDLFGTITIGATSGVVQFIFAKTTSGTATIYDEGTQLKIERW